MNSPVFHALTLADIRREAPDAVSFAFAVPPGLAGAYRFAPGQYLTLRATIGGEDLRRSYSICSDASELRVAVRRVAGGVFSNWLNDAAVPGMMLEVMTPMGRFGLPQAAGPRRVAAFAAGSGITPILSILRAFLAHERGEFFLFYGNRDSGHTLFREQLADLKDRYLSRLTLFHILSREEQELAALNGRLDADKLGALIPTLLAPATIDQVLVCGPQGMIAGLEPALEALGVARERIHVERFTPAPDARPRPVVVQPDAPPAARATIVHDGARRTIPLAADETIIDAALRAGLNLPYSCKAGMCCTCRARVTEGAVAMAVNYSLEPWETEAGFVLTCQSRPTTAHVVVDYDAA